MRSECDILTRTESRQLMMVMMMLMMMLMMMMTNYSSR